MALEKGTKVKVTGDKKPGEHFWQEGKLATAMGIDYPAHSSGDWQKFEDADGDTMWLKSNHFEIVATPVAIAKLIHPATDVASEDLPSKAVYAVTNSNDDVLATTADRDYARELKSALGGKRQGVRIFQYGAVKEIR
jgi:hypothetical protein